MTSEHDVPADVVERFGSYARETSALTARVHGRLAERLGLSQTDEKCLDLALRAEGPVTAGRIAELSGLSTGAVTGVIDRLEHAGYVRRVRDPHDRRKVLVEVTLGEEARSARLSLGAQAALAEVLSGFTPEERDVLERYSRTVIEAFRKRVVDA
ncbi:MarR family transcriptional regulator [Saccharothrix longispora]|uniref:MarR family winged helix-turn-helix transcriptional regulator n=1 Tax=Saccharothrix longispora TaxID=33920 RepID=UPI0028FD6B12|nr:MarR family transcriptional regulator [Saccharothrix longispora]MBY8847534.1 MarR family transcriptional regulator [Saccharothrix sp. MB29]MDU0293677.1 MarR family transcriptional regulator [Saccharothrix longispora]